MEDDIYKKISKQLLLEDCQSVFSLFEQIKNEDYSPIFILQAVTYLSFLCNGILDFYNIKYVEEINVKEESIKKIINDMRIKVKLYSEDNAKPKKSMQDLEKIHLDFYNSFKKLYDNANPVFKLRGLIKLYDFGAYSISGKYIGNTYLNYWYLNKILGVEEIGTEECKENVILFSTGLGYILKFVCDKEHISKKTFDLNTEIKVQSKDFLLMSNSTKILNDKYYKYSSLLLFNIICSINFVIYFLDKVLPQDNQFYFRVKFICYYSSISSLRKLVNYIDNNHTIKTGIENYVKQIKKLEEFKKSLGEESKLRNCLLHYKISEKYVSKEEILLNEPFYGLINKYTGRDYYTFNHQLDDNLKDISLMLERWILNENK